MATDLRTHLVRLASELPKGSAERKAVLELVKQARGIGMDPIREWKSGDDAGKVRVVGDQVQRASDIMRMVKLLAEKTPTLDRKIASDAAKLTRALDDLYMQIM